MYTEITFALLALYTNSVLCDYYPGYHGPAAFPHVLPDGHIADTHEVAAAKAQHYAAVDHARAQVDPYHVYSSGIVHGYPGYPHHSEPYHGPLAYPVVLPSGYLADTHEVAAAKHQHYAAVHGAQADYAYHGYY